MIDFAIFFKKSWKFFIRKNHENAKVKLKTYFKKAFNGKSRETDIVDFTK